MTAKQMREITNANTAKPSTRPYEYYYYHEVEPRLYAAAKKGYYQTTLRVTCLTPADEEVVDKIITKLTKKKYKVSLDLAIGVMTISWQKKGRL